MGLIITLILAGLILISFEVVVPGGILGTLGFISYAAACFFAYETYGPMTAILLFIGTLLLTALLLILEFKWLPKTKPGAKLFLKSTSGGSSKAHAQQDTIIGKLGKTSTTLAPSGMVEIDGKLYEAFSMDGLLEKNISIQVVKCDNFRLVVKKSR
ncbi:MAG TPA: serine protease [Opitutae bacterium]|nr:serine protease [Opitutae bacterium]|tara:strand:+ start:11514 stop:11981 length:468 start_codon:yes stop_codon:yes gene_type:complete